MLVRSTGLGRSEMEGGFETVDKKADYLVFGMRTTAPVKWHIRVAMEFSDIFRALILVVTSPQALGFIITQLFKTVLRMVTGHKTTIRRPEDF